MVTQVVFVDELILACFNADRINLGSCGKGVFQNPAVGQAFELGTHKGCPFTRFDMQKFNHLINVVVEFKAKTVAKF